MATYFAVVKVEPPGTVLRLADPNEPLRTTFRVEQKVAEFTFLTEKCETIVVRVDTNWDAPLSEIRVLVEHLTHRLYAVVSLLSNHFIQITVHSVTNADNRAHEAFRQSWPILDTFAADLERNPDGVSTVFQVGLTNSLLSVALEDYRLATGHLWSGPFFCYRSVESVRQHFRVPEDGGNKQQSWERMRNALHLDETYTRFLWDASNPIRHGDTIQINVALSIQCLAHSRNIIFRFIEYLRTGQLDENGFPILRD